MPKRPAKFRGVPELIGGGKEARINIESDKGKEGKAEKIPRLRPAPSQ